MRKVLLGAVLLTLVFAATAFASPQSHEGLTYPPLGLGKLCIDEHEYLFYHEGSRGAVIQVMEYNEEKNTVIPRHCTVDGHFDE